MRLNGDTCQSLSYCCCKSEYIYIDYRENLVKMYMVLKGIFRSVDWFEGSKLSRTDNIARDPNVACENVG